MPHSRWNDLPEEALAACGYRVLSRSAQAGVDAFVKHRNSLFVFFQGHPEYDADSLLLEYRRDIRRFLRGERAVCPGMPRGYFGRRTLARLQAAGRRDLAALSTALETVRVRNTWRAAAVRIYRRWLLGLESMKEQRLRNRHRRRVCQ
jgi:homoserine O-succinyltransferase